MRLPAQEIRKKKSSEEKITQAGSRSYTKICQGESNISTMSKDISSKKVRCAGYENLELILNCKMLNPFTKIMEKYDDENLTAYGLIIEINGLN